MTKGFNKVILMGNLTRDPELRTTPSGQSVASFSLAVNRSWRNANGEQQEAVDYIDFTRVTFNINVAIIKGEVFNGKIISTKNN